ncbi:MAG: hypothetical protein NKF70_14680 [Methanobacterium sp. ERen5]|nr:MAG: hypothetical protein NKF70_14680 [Methanobacterium sp. ERen5]
MTNEKITDIFIATLLKESEINYVPNDGITKEVKDALKKLLKIKQENKAFPNLQHNLKIIY